MLEKKDGEMTTHVDCAASMTSVAGSAGQISSSDAESAAAGIRSVQSGEVALLEEAAEPCASAVTAHAARVFSSAEATPESSVDESAIDTLSGPDVVSAESPQDAVLLEQACVLESALDSSHAEGEGEMQSSSSQSIEKRLVDAVDERPASALSDISFLSAPSVPLLLRRGEEGISKEYYSGRSMSVSIEPMSMVSSGGYGILDASTRDEEVTSNSTLIIDASTGLEVGDEGAGNNVAEMNVEVSSAATGMNSGMPTYNASLKRSSDTRMNSEKVPAVRGFAVSLGGADVSTKKDIDNNCMGAKTVSSERLKEAYDDLDDLDAADIPLPTLLERSSGSVPGAFHAGGREGAGQSQNASEYMQDDDAVDIEAPVSLPVQLISATLVEADQAVMSPVKADTLAMAEPVIPKTHVWGCITMVIIILIAATFVLGLTIHQQKTEESMDEHKYLEDLEDIEHTSPAPPDGIYHNYHAVSWGRNPHYDIKTEPVLEMTCESGNTVELVEDFGWNCVRQGSSTMSCERIPDSLLQLPHWLEYRNMTFGSIILFECHGERDTERISVRLSNMSVSKQAMNASMVSSHSPVEFLSIASLCQKSAYSDDIVLLDNELNCSQGQSFYTETNQQYCYQEAPCEYHDCRGDTLESCCDARFEPFFVHETDVKRESHCYIINQTKSFSRMDEVVRNALNYRVFWASFHQNATRRR
jgi:hypothetical protein